LAPPGRRSTPCARRRSAPRRARARGSVSSRTGRPSSRRERSTTAPRRAESASLCAAIANPPASRGTVGGAEPRQRAPRRSPRRDRPARVAGGRCGARGRRARSVDGGDRNTPNASASAAVGREQLLIAPGVLAVHLSLVRARPRAVTRTELRLDRFPPRNCAPRGRPARCAGARRRTSRHDSPSLSSAGPPMITAGRDPRRPAG